MLNGISNRLNQKKLWRVVGFMSSIVGLLCYALSSSFKHLFGELNFLKIILYTVVSFIISNMMLFLKKWKLSRSFLQKAHVGVLVLLLTSLYSFEIDKAVNGKPDLLSLISSAAFALMSLCLSKQINLGFETDLLNFFLGCLTVQLMKINLILCIITAIFSYSLMVLYSKLGSQSEIGTLEMDNHVIVEIDAADGVERGGDDNRSKFQFDHTNGSQQIEGLRRRQDDGYNWRKYEEKQVRRSENKRSYYKCTYPNCSVKKKVERDVNGQIIEILYEGTHVHWKPEHTVKRNSSFEYLYSLLPSEPVLTDMPDQSFASHGSGQLDYDATSEKSSVSI
ncbi:uncharacterized protein LOC133308569 [Gastrolobium bilobum]|uniref:uncharacterized protein LOC133308569 n=1 Tax=Gastrolobium bilobum TaxID=150636 RepID=UPI002AAF93C6|nr:uncharacterized protein LOC133308569 [Gastrolobium bilobum]